MKEINRRQVFGLTAGSIAAVGMPAIVRAQAPVTLKFANFAGPTSFLTTGIFRPAFDAIEADSEGTLKIDIISGGSLAKAEDTYDAVRKGLADMGWSITSYTPGRFKTATIVELPFAARDCKTASHGLWRLHEQNLLDGFKGVEVFTVMSSGILLAHASKPITGLEGFKGERVRAAGAIASAMWESVGAIPIALPAPAVAESLSKNTLMGAMNDWNALQTWGIMEFVKWHLEAPLGSSPCFITVNKAVFDKLPAPAKAALQKHAGPRFNDFWGDRLEAENRRIRAVVAGMSDHTILTPTDAQIAQWKAMTASVTDKWIETAPDGRKALDVYHAALVEAR
jgi:TRAP-type C4-dicarboxylate transport system substrate-binding protein